MLQHNSKVGTARMSFDHRQHTISPRLAHGTAATHGRRFRVGQPSSVAPYRLVRANHTTPFSLTTSSLLAYFLAALAVGLPLSANPFARLVAMPSCSAVRSRCLRTLLVMLRCQFRAPGMLALTSCVFACHNSLLSLVSENAWYSVAPSKTLGLLASAENFAKAGAIVSTASPPPRLSDSKLKAGWRHILRSQSKASCSTRMCD